MLRFWHSISRSRAYASSRAPLETGRSPPPASARPLWATWSAPWYVLQGYQNQASGGGGCPDGVQGPRGAVRATVRKQASNLALRTLPVSPSEGQDDSSPLFLKKHVSGTQRPHSSHAESRAGNLSALPSPGTLRWPLEGTPSLMRQQAPPILPKHESHTADSVRASLYLPGPIAGGFPSEMRLLPLAGASPPQTSVLLRRFYLSSHVTSLSVFNVKNKKRQRC